MENFLGKDGFVWWKGVIENRDDPLHLGRCQVRIFGWHTDNIQQLPSNGLPWAIPAHSPNSTMTSDTPLVGDFAFGFFMDGESAQMPVLLGIFPGIPTQGASKDKGFSEGSHYPIGEPTTSRLYRNENIANTAIGYHDTNIVQNVATSNGGTWSEPKSTYKTIPPHNKVTQTECGHIIELDDTKGAERIHINHGPSNTFIEIASDGTTVSKISGTSYKILLKDNNVLIKGTCNVTIEGDSNLQINGNSNINVKGNVKQTIGGSYTGSASSWNLTGDVNIKGKVTSTGDVVGGGISLDGHTHPDPQGGSTGTPQ